MTARLLIAIAIAACAPRGPHLQTVHYGDGSRWEYDARDNLPDGQSHIWYRNNQLRSEGTYLAGMRHGRFRFWAENGAFDHQALFSRNVEVWRSADVLAEPPADLVANIAAQATEAPPASDFAISSDPVPAPYFATLDHATALHRLGVDFGTGSIRRMALYGSYAWSRVGVFGELLETDYAPTSAMSYAGKRTAELGGTLYVPVLEDLGALTARASLLVPVGNDDQNGYIASAAGAAVHPSDVATSFPSAVAVRTGASFTSARRYIVAQGDAGIDWIAAGQARPLDAVVRANAGIGFGGRAAMASFELTNSIRLTDPSRRLHAAAVAGTLWFARLWLTTAFAYGFDGSRALNVGVGYEL